MRTYFNCIPGRASNIYKKEFNWNSIKHRRLIWNNSCFCRLVSKSIMTQKNHNKDSIKHQSPHNQEIKLLGDSPDLINISDTYNSIAYPQRDRFSQDHHHKQTSRNNIRPWQAKSYIYRRASNQGRYRNSGIEEPHTQRIKIVLETG